MLWLYLDESGDLGFDFVQKKPSNFFTVCVLSVQGRANRVGLRKAVKRTLKRKIKRSVHELKGTETAFEVKEYFWRCASRFEFHLYSMTLNKKRVYESLIGNKDRVYNWIARLTFDHVPLAPSLTRVQVVIDRSKSRKEIEEFNRYLTQHLESRLHPSIPLDVDHLRSHDDPLLQAADLFSWGIFRKYEEKDEQWLNLFRSRVQWDDLYLP